MIKTSARYQKLRSMTSRRTFLTSKHLQQVQYCERCVLLESTQAVSNVLPAQVKKLQHQVQELESKLSSVREGSEVKKEE